MVIIIIIFTTVRVVYLKVCLVPYKQASKLFPFDFQQIQREIEIQAEDEQVFLMRQQTALSKQPPAGQRQVCILK